MKTPDTHPRPAPDSGRLKPRLFDSLRIASATALVAIATLMPAKADYASTVQSFSPLGYWRLNETNAAPVETGIATAINSGSGAGINGVYTNYGSRGVAGALVGSGDTAVTLNGSNQNVIIPYSADLNPAQGQPWTAEIWAKSNISGTLPPFSSGSPAATNRQGWVLYFFGADLSFRAYTNNGANATINGGSGLTMPGLVAPNTWYHVVVTCDGTDFRIYLNGTQVGTTPTVGPNGTYSAGTTGTALGQRVGAPNWFNGSLDDAAFYTTALSSGVIQAHYQNGTNSPARTQDYEALVAASNPVAYYRLNDPEFVSTATAVNSGSLSTAADGNYGVGTTPGQPGPDPSTSPPLTGLNPNVACAFNGSGSITCGNNAGLNLNQISVAAWIKVGTLVANMDVVAKGNSSWRLQIDGSTRHLKWVCPGGNITGIKFVNDGLWHHVVAVSGSNGSALYVDGVLDGSNAAAVNSIPVTTDAVTIGSGAGARWNGSIDEVAIFGTALTGANAQALYAGSEPPILDTAAVQATSTVEASHLQRWSDGTDYSTITVTCKNAAGGTVTGKNVTLTSSRSATDTITSSSGNSDSNGQVIFTLTSETAGAAVLTATDTDDNFVFTQIPTVTFVTKPADLSEYLPNATVVGTWDAAHGNWGDWTPERTTSFDSQGNYVLGKAADPNSQEGWIYLPSTKIPAGVSYVNSGLEVTWNLAPKGIAGQSENNHIMMFTWDNDVSGFTRQGFFTETEGSGTAGKTAQMFADGNWTKHNWSTPPTMPMTGNHTMAMVRYANGTLDTYVDGIKVGSAATTDPATPLLKRLGIGYQMAGNWYLTRGTVVYQARAFTVTDPVGPVDVGTSTVVATHGSTWADGSSTDTITVTLKDAGGNPNPDKSVSLAHTSGLGSPVINTITGTTGPDGKAVFTVSSSTLGTAVFTATDDTDSLQITQTASVNFLDPATPRAVYVTMDNSLRSGLVGPAGGSGQSWNQRLAGVATFGTNLLDASGPVSTVDYTTSGTSWGGPDPWGNPSLDLIKAGLRNFDTSPTNSQQLVITNVPAGKYDLYIASALCDSNQKSKGEWSTTNVTSTVGSQSCDNTANVNGTTWVRGNNYVLFKDVAPNSSGSITVNGKSLDGYRLPLNGFQLVQTDYVTWVSGYLPDDISDPTADFDGDGLTNHKEYAFGLDPTSASSVNPITDISLLSGGQFSYTRRKSSGLNYTVVYSVNLIDWTPDAAAGQSPGVAVDGVETVVVTLSGAVAPFEGKLFVRVLATE
jgi:hypothetical protein